MEYVIVVIGLATFYLQQKLKNLASKQDVADITDKVESIKLLYASQLHVSQVRYEKSTGDAS